MKILVIFTGGTIGSKLQNGRISPDSGAKYELTDAFREKYPSVRFDTAEPYTVLSEYLSADTLNSLIKCVKSNLYSGYNGIIVTHGTDTLQYSAAALSFALGCDCAPVVLVSSNYPLSDARANGKANFEAAVEFIRAKAGRGVFVIYENSVGRVDIHRASRVLSHGEMSDALFSAGGEPFAFYKNGIITKNGKYIAFDTEEFDRNFTFADSSQILVVNMRPGDDFLYDLSPYRAVILRPYHSGTLNSRSASLDAFCRKAKEASIPVYLVNAPSGDTYESAEKLGKLGIIPLKSAGFIPIYVKLWAFIGREDFASLIKENLADEFLP